MKFIQRHILTGLFAGLMILSGCIDPIEFDTGSESRRLVVEGLISNVSYNERELLPNYPERFYVKLQWTGPVNNERNDVISDATVHLVDDLGEAWEYIWVAETSSYLMPFDDFKAEPGRSYHLRIELSDGKVYESEEETMHVAPSLPGVDYSLITRIQEINVGEQTQFEEQRGLVLSAQVPEHDDDETFYFRYKVTPSWVYVAPLPPQSSPVKTCYVTNKFYFQKINTKIDRTGGYNNELFFLETENNQRLYRDFSAYVTQYSLSPLAHEFWNQLAIQQESGGGIFDPPPFELFSNVYNVEDPEEKVSGFFSVAHESSVRWFINGSELPYEIDNGMDPCVPPPGTPNIPTPDCLNCLEYRGGSSFNTTERPSWWRQY